MLQSHFLECLNLNDLVDIVVVIVAVAAVFIYVNGENKPLFLQTPQSSAGYTAYLSYLTYGK